MKKSVLFVIGVLLSIAIFFNSCGTKKQVAREGEIPYEVARGYFVKTDSCMNCKVIKSESEFNKYFAKIFTQEESDKPTSIDFNKSIVIATVFPATMEKFYVSPVYIIPSTVSDSIDVHSSHGYYRIKKTAVHRPFFILIVDKKYENKGFRSFMWGRGSSGSPSLTPYLAERNKLLIE